MAQAGNEKAPKPGAYFSAHVFCCTNERIPGHKKGCCSSKGAEDLRGYMKARCRALGLESGGRLRINAAGCLDRCHLGPAMVIYPEGIWYRYESESDIDEIIESHLVGGKPVLRLLLDASR